MCRKELGGAAKFRDGRRPSCSGELREAVIVHFADGGLSFSCWETRVLDKKRRYRKLARPLGWSAPMWSEFRPPSRKNRCRHSLPSPQCDGHLAVLLARRSDRDFHILSERRQKFHETPHGEAPGTVAHEQRNVRLLDAQRPASFGLRHSALLDDAVQLECQFCLRKRLCGIGQATTGEHLAAALGDSLGY